MFTDEQETNKPLLSPDLMLKAFELAEKMAPVQYSYSGNGGATAKAKEVKDVTHIADQIVAWVTGKQDSDTKNLLARLKTVLCEAQK